MNSRKGLSHEFYAKTLISVQSSGMGKSRLADAFGEYCPMINFVLREEGTIGYPPADGKVLSFMLKNPSKEIKKEINDSPKAHGISSMRNLEENRKAASNSPALEKLKSAIRNQQPEEPPARESRPTKRARQPEEEPYLTELRSTKRNQLSGEVPSLKKLRSTERNQRSKEPPARELRPT